jgi:hypothetical protein
VLKFGGGKALTKQPSEETTLKCHMTVEEVSQVGEGVTKVVDNNALAICDAHAGLEGDDQLEIVPTEVKSETSRLGKIMLELYNLEKGVVSEGPVKIDLDLYQMEKV